MSISVYTGIPISHDISCPDFFRTIPVCQEKDGNPINKNLSELHKYRFWQPNAHQTTWVLMVDLDSDDWMLRTFELCTQFHAPMPTWVIEKDDNGHGQLGWVIEHVSHAQASHAAPQLYARDVRQALTNAFGGDQAFTNSRAWNPFWTGWEQHGRVMWGSKTPYKLGELRAALLKADSWNPKPPVQFRKSLASSAGRNEFIFDYARLRAHGTVKDAARAANSQLENPLGEAEVNGIIRSIEKFEARTGWTGGVRAGGTGDKSAFAALGSAGGSKNTDAQKAARKKGPAAASALRSADAVGRSATIIYWSEMGLSRREIMAKMNVSESTVKRALRAHRAKDKTAGGGGVTTGAQGSCCDGDPSGAIA